MNQRALVVVAAIAAVCVALVLLTQRSGDSGAGANEPWLPELAGALGAIEQITIVGPGEATIATLDVSEQGWTVAERDGYPADLGKIRAALRALSEASTLEAKTADPAYYDRLGVQSLADTNASGVGIGVTAAGSTLPMAILGDSVGTSYRYARRADQARSYLIDRDPDVPRDTAQWLVTDILDVRGNRVQQVTITHADGERVSISKPRAEQNNFDVADVPDDRELQYPGVANVIGNALRELKLEDVARFDDSTADLVATTEFRAFDGLIVTARTFQVDDEDWLVFEAGFDADQAVQFASDDVVEPLAGAESGLDPREEAATINARVAGWRYRIASYQHDQLTRRMQDLLKARS